MICQQVRAAVPETFTPKACCSTALLLLFWWMAGVAGFGLGPTRSHAQSHLPFNGVRDHRASAHLFTNARIYLGPGKVLDSAMLLERNGKIVQLAKNIPLPLDAVEINVGGQWIFPALIELIGEIPAAKEGQGTGNTRFFRDNPQMFPARNGAFGANDAIRPDQAAVQVFQRDAKWAEGFRKAGFGVVNAHIPDGLVRGSSVLVGTLGPDALAPVESHLPYGPTAHQAVLKEEAAAFWSFEKGSSTQDYPSSLMGCMALLRQTLYDKAWYQSLGKERNFTDLGLEHIGRLSRLPQIFVTNNKYDILRAHRIAQEFQLDFIYKGSGEEYQYVDAVRALGRPVVLPLRFPEVPDLSDPLEARRIGLSSLVHWDQAPANAALLRKAGVPIALTSNGLDKPESMVQAVRKAIESGLPWDEAITALTLTPARLLGMDSLLGSLAPGKYAHLLIVRDSLFKEQGEISSLWLQGQHYPLQDQNSSPSWTTGSYRIVQGPLKGRRLELTNKAKPPHSPKYTWTVHWNDSTKNDAKAEYRGGLVHLNLEHKIQEEGVPSPLRMSLWPGKGVVTGRILGNKEENLPMEAVLDTAKGPAKKDGESTTPQQDSSSKGSLAKAHRPEPWDSLRLLPLADLGRTRLGVDARTSWLIREAQVWTCGPAGRLETADVAVANGKILAVGPKLDPKVWFKNAEYKTIYAAGQHLTPGLIDEHSHIAITRGVNEGTRSITSEVRIGDALDPDDPNIYRQLAGGVTTSHLLHGSANSIGGQTQLIRMRWGVTDPEKLKFEGAPGFIKFALGENVKQSNWGDRNTVRFPQTRMGVEQTIMDGFIRAIEYEQNRKVNPVRTRRDLTLEALLEIRNNKRHITCHSYVQSEINMLMKVADSIGFKVNTFTHILEGFKVADKMKQHGANASSFADWWAYKYEVIDAIPYNAAILHRMGVNVAINSDDAEMARRLNQEAAKAVRYGGITEVDALNMVTINPARMLRVDDRVGSIEPGKDADLVLWNGHPLSVYSRPVHTMVEGRTCYEADADRLDHEAREELRLRLVQKALRAKSEGAPTGPAFRRGRRMYHCEDLGGLQDQDTMVEHSHLQDESRGD